MEKGLAKKGLRRTLILSQNDRRALKSWEDLWRRTEVAISIAWIPNMREYFDLCNFVIRRYHVSKVLDAGSGSGLSSLPYAAKGLGVVLVDTSREALKLARAVYHSLGLSAHFVMADAFHTPFRGGSFDLVHNEGVLEHYERDEAVEMLKEMARASSELVLAKVPYWWSISYRARKLYHRLFGTRWPWGGEIERDYRADELVDEVKAAGLRVLFSRYLGRTGRFDIFPTPRWLTRLLKRSPRNRPVHLTSLRSLMESVYKEGQPTLMEIFNLLGRLTGSHDHLIVLGKKLQS